MTLVAAVVIAAVVAAVWFSGRPLPGLAIPWAKIGHRS